MMISETKSILSFPDLIARQLIRIHFTCFTVFVQFILGPLGRVALSPTAHHTPVLSQSLLILTKHPIKNSQAILRFVIEKNATSSF
jgi:hypothetical protein